MEGPRRRPKPSAVRIWHVSPEGFRDLRMAVFSARQSMLGTLAFPFVPFAIGTPVEAAFLGLLFACCASCVAYWLPAGGRRRHPRVSHLRHSQKPVITTPQK